MREVLIRVLLLRTLLKIKINEYKNKFKIERREK